MLLPHRPATPSTAPLATPHPAPAPSATRRPVRATAVACGALALSLAGLAAVPAADASAATPRCHTSVLEATIGTTGHAAGTTYASLVLRNGGRSTCHVRGYPGIGLIGNGGDVPVDPVRDPSLAHATKGTVLLRPGGHASALLAIPGCAGGGGAREGLKGVFVTPPDERQVLRASSSQLGWYCGATPRVGFFVRGTHGIEL